ncbi:uncharacterized protein LOC114575563 [Exaiptasia diaphana]|uniref:Uncharacterized protein n=1 Tax=Exaiptasia diaphana TaxID=2652724 RepID=A0A913YPN6_EXADI|nr:uncharacterized protein LOC114575563 [Exaiptasia diaphana]
MPKAEKSDSKAKQGRKKESGLEKRERRSKKKQSPTESQHEGDAATIVNPRTDLLSHMKTAGYDGSHFVCFLEAKVKDRLKRGKTSRRNRYLEYCHWAYALLRKKIGPETNAEFAYPPSVLQFIRHLVPGDIKGEIRENAYKVSMEEFCSAMELPRSESDDATNEISEVTE